MGKRKIINKAVKKVKASGFHTFKGKDHGAFICVSAEHGDDAADYYGEFRGSYPWINPKLEKIAEEAGLFWQWLSPGAIGLYEV